MQCEEERKWDFCKTEEIEDRKQEEEDNEKETWSLSYQFKVFLVYFKLRKLNVEIF